MVLARLAPTGKMLALAALVAPLSTVRYVDAGTLLPESTQNGSSVAPYSTVQAAVTSLEDEGVIGGVVYIAPGTYAEAVTVSVSMRLSGIGIHDCGFPASANGNPGVELLSLTSTAPSTSFLSVAGCRVETLTTSNGVKLNIIDSRAGTVTAAASLTTLSRVQIGGAISVLNFSRAFDTQFNGAITLNSASAASLFLNCLMAGAADITTAGGTVLFDDLTEWFFRSVNNTVTGGLTQVQAALGRAVLTFNVPVLAAGVLGTATATCTGTELDGISTLHPVSATRGNSAGGIGSGALLGAFVNVTNTITCQFLGPTTGGNADITIVRTANRN